MVFPARSPFRLPTLLCALCFGFVSVASAAESMGQWRGLAPLPDPIGFSGMFAGVLQGQLIVGGGSQFEQPLWKGGVKRYTDKMWALASVEGDWQELPLKLPLASAHFASAASPGAIYLAGGIGDAASLKVVHVLRENGELREWERLADLPAPVVYACASIANGRLFVIGGVSNPSSKAPLRAVWSLALSKTGEHPGWRREADLPGPGVFVATATAVGNNLYVFGGMAVDPEGNYAPSSRAYVLDTTTGQWRELAALPEPRAGPLSAALGRDDDRILIAGGYSEVFAGSPREHPAFDTRTFFYDPKTNAWSDGPVLPQTPVVDRDAPSEVGPAPMIGAPGIVWREFFLAINGEVRPSVRSTQVLAWPISNPVSPLFSK
tara:strand:- start:163 stop:1296 length:1134 start_codon:yes stop_codon:yes gene_type:complete